MRLDEEDSFTRRLDALGIDPAGSFDETVTLGRALVSAPIFSQATLPRLELGGEGSELVALGLLAEGGMGRVLHARQTALARNVAVKTTKAMPSPIDVSCLLREAQVVGALEHPSIVPIYALGETADGHPLLVMRKIEGFSWAELLRNPAHEAWALHAGAEDDRLDANIDILTAIAHALDFAHERGLVHRDVKPSNVMLGRYGEVYLVDWGLATAAGTRDVDDLVGTPGYMAPEMVNGEVIDATTDVYLLGATLHRVLTGAVRHRAETTVAAVSAAMISAVAAYPDDVPRALADLCNAACSPVRSARPASAAAFREELLAFKRHRVRVAIRTVARERLTALETLLGEAAAGAPRDLALAYRLATEARFGFAQALALHRSDEETQAGAAAALECLVDLEVRQGHLDTATALLDETPESKRLLLPRIEEARRAQRAALDEQAGHLALGRSLDPRRGWRARVLLIGALLLVMVLTNLTIPAPVPGASPSAPLFIILLPALPCAIIAVGSVFARRWLLASAFNSRFVALTALAAFGSLVHRVVAHGRGTPYFAIFVDDLVLFAVAVAAIAITLLPRFALAIPVLLGTAALIEVRHDLALPIFPWTVTAVVALAVALLWRRHRTFAPNVPRIGSTSADGRGDH